jgi:SAM-dependent methyltransferase
MPAHAMNPPEDRWHSPAADRNKQPILEVLRRWLPAQGTALEVACGTGQHACHLAAGLPGWTWWPTDPDPGALASAAAWAADAALPGLRRPQRLDATEQPWSLAEPAAPDLVFCANMIHIAPWSAALGLLRGAAQRLAPGGALVLYGPFLATGLPDAPGNLAFDADLRQRHPEWGVRRLGEVEAAAAGCSLQLADRAAMPANNLMLRFERG